MLTASVTAGTNSVAEGDLVLRDVRQFPMDKIVIVYKNLVRLTGLKI